MSAITGFALFLASNLLGVAGVTTYDGTEEGFWSHRSMIVARLERLTLGETTGELHLQVLAVLATDQMIQTEIDVQYSLRKSNSALIRFDPVAGETYILYVFRRSRADPWMLPNEFNTFLSTPARTAAAERVAGLDDKRVLEVATKIFEVRARYFALHGAGRRESDRESR